LPRFLTPRRPAEERWLGARPGLRPPTAAAVRFKIQNAAEALALVAA
jgi:hypothetical protein